MQQVSPLLANFAQNPQLRADICIHSVDQENGFLETSQELFRLKSPKLQIATRHLFPLLDGCTPVEEIIQQIQPYLSEKDILDTLETMQQQSLLKEPSTIPGVAPTPSFIVTGTGTLVQHFTALLHNIGSAHVQAFPVESFQDIERLADEISVQSCRLLFIATSSLLDPRIAAINEVCIAQNIPCLFIGLDHHLQGFVGPLWDPNSLSPCYECLCLRLHMNSQQGAIREAYRGYLRQSQQLPLQHTAPPFLSMHLVSWADWMATGFINGKAANSFPGEVVCIEGESLTATRHRLLPVPHCRACHLHQQRNQDKIQASGTLRDACDRKVGIIHSIQVKPQEPGSPKIHIYNSTSSNIALIIPTRDVVHNSGAGYTEEAALNAAIGESLERYASGLYHQQNLILSSWKQLQQEAIHPSTVGLYSTEQYAQSRFPFVPFTEDTVVRWTEAFTWLDRRRVWVPAFLTYLPYRLTKTETHITHTISTGLAAGASLEAAVLSGLYEVLERDALAISWLHRLPPQHVPDEIVKACPNVWARLEESAGKCRVRFYNLALDFPFPVIFALMEYDGADRSFMTVGCACRFSLVEAVEKAFLEASQGVPYIRYLLQRYQNWEPGTAFKHVDSFTKHAILYSKYPHLRQEVKYLLHPDAQLVEYRQPNVTNIYQNECSKDVQHQLASIVDDLQTKNYNVYCVDLTTPDLRQLGLFVARVIVPGLQHISGIHKYRLLGNPRLYEVVQKLGYQTLPNNPYPHPLP